MELNELWKDLGVVTGRVASIFPLLLVVALFMGRRSIGELPVFDFLIVLALGSVVGADIADPSIHHIPTAAAILMIGLMQKLFSILVIRSRRFGKLVTFEPILVIHQGRILVKNLKTVKYSIDNILQMLRENQIFDIANVDLAVLEANGKLSVLEKPDAKPTNLSYPIIREGRIEQQVLSRLKLNEEWVYRELERRNLRLDDIFIATLDDNKTLTITLQSESHELPPLFH